MFSLDRPFVGRLGPGATTPGRLTAAGSWSLGGVRGEPVSQVKRTAEADVVAAVDLVGIDAEALASVAPRPGGREHSVVAAEEIPRRRLRPGLKGPRLLQRVRSLVPFSPPCLGRKLRRDVMVEDILVPALLVAGVRPPVREELPGRRDHCRDEDEKVDWDASADKRCRKAAERVAHDHDSAAVADCPHDGVGVLLPTGRLVLAREIDGHSIMPALAQRRRNQVTVPRAPTTSVDERERRHRGHATRGPTRDAPGSGMERSWSSRPANSAWPGRTA